MAQKAELRHVRPVQPVEFPPTDPEWDMPQSTRHARLCALLYAILANNFARAHGLGADQFVYFDAEKRRRRLAPDAFVKLGQPTGDFSSWFTWERGTPELCVEILSPSDSEEKLTFREKLVRYRALGTRELAVFNVDGPVGKRLRVWDRIKNDFVERIVKGETTPCLALGCQWVLVPTAFAHVALRLARKPDGELLLTEGEIALARENAALARENAALARVAQLEAKLKKRR